MTGNVYAGLHDFEEMTFVLHVLRHDDLFVDIGANVGAYTILACSAAGANGVAFEPVPRTFQRLMDNVRLNNLEQRVRCFNAAIASHDGQLTFTGSHDAMNHVVTNCEEATNTTTVNALSLDDALDGLVPFMLKIDVEGYETPVVRGGQKTFADPRLKSVIMELNESGLRYGFKDAELMLMMHANGFSACRYDPFARTLVKELRCVTGSGNVIFVRDIDFVSDRLLSAATVQVHGVGL